MAIVITWKEIKAHSYLFKKSELAPMWRILKLGRKPVIIGGCGRSGTTLLLSILSCHPHLFAIDEETRAFCPDGYRQNPDLNKPFKLKKLYDYLLRHKIPATCTRWCEKTPRNVLYYERILKYFGKRVRVINMVRDGRDVITSLHPSDPAKFWITPERWINDVSAGKQYSFHPQVKTIRYEDIIHQYEPTIRSICEFIKEPFDERLLSYGAAAPINRSVAWFEEAKPITDSSIGRWHKAEYRERVAALLSQKKARELLAYYQYR
jgi:hypothetical protein